MRRVRQRERGCGYACATYEYKQQRHESNYSIYLCTRWEPVCCTDL